jgi:hypothetical protein
VFVGAAAVPTTAWAQTPTAISWRGYQWNVKSGSGLGPGVNDWSPSNVFVDANGDLHLAITNTGGTWTCAEVASTVSFGFGTFQWEVSTAVDALDANVVLGLFVYGPPALGPDGTHEIDIEYARFGSATGDNAWWTIYPNVLATPRGRSSYQLALTGDGTTTARFAWAANSVGFATLGGYQAAGTTANLLHAWTYLPSDPTTSISQSPMPVHMNLWLQGGNPPASGQGTEVVIHDFSFTPATGPSVPALPGPGPFVLAVCFIALVLIVSGPTMPRRRP